jgi:hypothetical protein
LHERSSVKGPVELSVVELSVAPTVQPVTRCVADEAGIGAAAHAMANALFVGDREISTTSGMRLRTHQRSDAGDPHEPRVACEDELVDPPGEVAHLGIDQLESLDPHQPSSARTL